MSQFLNRHLVENQGLLENYAGHGHQPCDLSLISGPCLWEAELQSATKHLAPSCLESYSDPGQLPELLEILGNFDGLSPESLWLTCGADAAIEEVLTRFLGEGDTLGILTPNFPRFGIVAATLPGVKCHYFSSLDTLPAGLKAVALCTPNNPDTSELPQQALAQVMKKHPETLFILDGVFDWYASYSLAALVQAHPNALLLKSFSKIGLAGLRLGYVVAHPDIIRDLQIGLSPFFVSRLTQKIGLEVARNFPRVQLIKEWLEEQFRPIEKEWGSLCIRKTPLPFYLLQTNRTSSEATALLAQEGISVVDGVFFRDLPTGLIRVAIGTQEQNNLLVSAVARLKLLA